MAAMFKWYSCVIVSLTKTNLFFHWQGYKDLLHTTVLITTKVQEHIEPYNIHIKKLLQSHLDMSSVPML